MNEISLGRYFNLPSSYCVCIEGVLVTNLYHNTVFLSVVFFGFFVLFSKAKIAI